MNLAIGAIPPLHRRFNERAALRYIRNRYRNIRDKVSTQVELLQKDATFREKCRTYYQKGYKDWVILSAIFNCMLNWRAQELGIKVEFTEDRKRFLEVQKHLHGVTYPGERFMGKDMDMHVKMHSLLALKTYGFEMRRRDFNPEVIEKFLRERMRHYDFDIPHSLLFGDPPGDWPKV